MNTEKNFNDIKDIAKRGLSKKTMSDVLETSRILTDELGCKGIQKEEPGEELSL
jgi:hypothetical protein